MDECQIIIFYNHRSGKQCVWLQWHIYASVSSSTPSLHHQYMKMRHTHTLRLKLYSHPFTPNAPTHIFPHAYMPNKKYVCEKWGVHIPITSRYTPIRSSACSESGGSVSTAVRLLFLQGIFTIFTGMSTVMVKSAPLRLRNEFIAT